METEEDRVRKRGPRDNRDGRGGREQGSGGRDNRDGRNGQGSRPDRRNDNRRNMALRTGMQLQSSDSRRAREIRRKIKREIIRRKNTETEAFEGKGKKGQKAEKCGRSKETAE